MARGQGRQLLSADNYLLIDKTATGFPVYHLFASDESDLDTQNPLYVGATLAEACRWASNWTKENVCEYGIHVTDEAEE